MSVITKVSARMDPELKSEAESLLQDMGLSFSTWITMATKALVNQRKIPFEVKASPFYSEKNQRILEERYARYKKHEGISEHDLLEDDDD